MFDGFFHLLERVEDRCFSHVASVPIREHAGST